MATRQKSASSASTQPSEFERLAAALGPLLEAAARADLSAADLAFLAEDAGIPADDLGKVIEGLKAHQRSRSVTSDAATTSDLLEGGYSSAGDVARSSEDD